MPEPRSQEQLQRDLEDFNAVHATDLGKLQNYLRTADGREGLAQVEAFRSLLDRPQAGIAGRSGLRVGAETFVALLREHPSFENRNAGGIGGPVFGGEAPGGTDVRRDAADFITAGVIALATIRTTDPRYVDALIRVAVGADDLANLLRNTLLGNKPFPVDGGRPVPQNLIDIMAVARKVVQPDRLAVSIVGPLSRARQGDVKAAVLGWR